jgi:hypothetical protein
VRPSERATSPTGRLMAAKRRAPVSHDEREQHVPIDRASVAPPQVGGAGAPPAGVELPPPPVAADRAGDQDGPAAPTPLEPAGAEEGTMTARLLAAKRRAQRREESE